MHTHTSPQPQISRGLWSLLVCHWILSNVSLHFILLYVSELIKEFLLDYKLSDNLTLDFSV